MMETAIPQSSHELAIVNSTQLQTHGETNVSASVARAQAEMQAKIIVARRFPRSEQAARQDLQNTVKGSPMLAERAAYRYPRGKKKDPRTGQEVENIISGPSTYIAREAARVWGNIDYGTEVMRDTDSERHIRCYAWDLQTNARRIEEVTFRKLVQRKKWVKKDGNAKAEPVTEWVTPDERDLRELTNKYGSIGERNCILKILPSSLIDEVLTFASQVTRETAAKHPETIRKRMADKFFELGITVPMLEDYLGHKLETCTPEEIDNLRGVHASLVDGEVTWDELRTAVLPDEEAVPEMPQLLERARTLRWNEAKLSSEIGRNRTNIQKLLADMDQEIAKLQVKPEAQAHQPKEQPKAEPKEQPKAEPKEQPQPHPQETPEQKPPSANTAERSAPELAGRKPNTRQRSLGDAQDF